MMEKKDINLVSRRGFLRQAGIASLALHPIVEAVSEAATVSKAGNIVYYLIRPSDLLCLRFEFENCSHCIFGFHAHKDAKVVIRLPQQHVAEDSHLFSDLDGSPISSGSDVSGYSYLVYQLRKGHIPFEAERWLNWDTGDPHGMYTVMDNPAVADTDQPGDLPTVTRFEFPLGLWLAPRSYQPPGDTLGRVFGWDQKFKPEETTYGGRNELWTAALRLALPDKSHPITPALAVTGSLPACTGSADCRPYTFYNSQVPSAGQKLQLFQQASDAGTDQRVMTNHAPFLVSPLGLTTKLLYRPGYAASVQNKVYEWQQQTVNGRDHFDQVATGGWIYPYMLRCEFVLIDRRATVIGVSGAPAPQSPMVLVAKFRRSQEMVNYMDVLSTAGAVSQNAAARGIPFVSVELLTVESPEFDLHDNFIQVNGLYTEGQGIPQVPVNPFWTVTDYDNQVYYGFEFQGTDHNGSVVRFTSPFIFIPDTPGAPAPQSPMDIDIVTNEFNATYGQITFTPPRPKYGAGSFALRNRAATNFQTINFIRDEAPGSVSAQATLRANMGSMQTEYLIFASWLKQAGDGSPFDSYTPVAKSPSIQVPFFPLLQMASVIYGPLKAFVSQGQAASMAQAVCYPALYLKDGVTNQSKVFLKMYANSLPFFDGSDVLELVNAVVVNVNDVVTGSISKATGTVQSIAGNVLTLSGVTGAFTAADSLVGIASSNVASFTNDLRNVGSLIRPSMQAAAFSLINGIVSTGQKNVPGLVAVGEDLQDALNLKGSVFQNAVASFIGLNGVPTFSPSSFLPKITMLGQDIYLSDLIDDIPIGDYITTAENTANQFIPIINSIENAQSVTAQFDWTVMNDKLKDFSILEWLYETNSDLTSSIAISCTQVVPLSSAVQVSSTANCVLSNFALNFWDYVTINFDEFSYENDSGTTHVNVKISDIEFGGSVSFINILAGFLQTLDDALQVAIADADIFITYALPIPSISLPCFDIVNVSINTNIDIPLDLRSTSLSFGFNSVQDPFTIAVAFFGGGGSVALGLNTKGIQGFSASFEFGGYFGLDLIVAQGDVYLFAGIYYSIGTNCVIMRAYIRCGGEMSVLDLITVSVSFYMDLQYQDDDNQTLLTGTCTVTVSISILFFSADVSLTFRKDLAGSAAGANGNILTDCTVNAPAPAEKQKGADADEAMPAKQPMPPPALGGGSFKNKRFKFNEHMAEEEWIHYVRSFAA